MPTIACLIIRLDEVEPEVVRRIEVPADIRLADLHLVIQIVMGWENYHLYEFRVGRSLRWGLPDPDWRDDTTVSAKKATLADVSPHLKRAKIFQYVYDFGDDWLHTVKIEAVVEAEPDAPYPRRAPSRQNSETASIMPLQPPRASSGCRRSPQRTLTVHLDQVSPYGSSGGGGK